ncbi:thiamine-phosphate kinase [Roseospirillum parvum]|uniref:Thiamine-monophosphate kinase n=1 Tax=Roseospirillum parvum TaxID=83401 RepID=A0A1G7Y645_9PROT|nr:thiamine-phosphate kinase [Roseospirillum parvum]SDG91803.1 thiamine-monophosphate kinase [Roseospirillum parvum]
MTSRTRSEFDLIGQVFAPLAKTLPGAFSLTDDAAVLTPTAGHDQVTTLDAVVAGIHFLADDPPELVAKKAVRVNLSDLAAMGARPRALFVAACLNRDLSDAWIDRFAAGLGEDLAAFDVALAGGDTVSTPGPTTLAVTAVGEVARGAALRRNGALPGDLVVVSGTIGDGAFGLMAARGELDGRLEAAECVSLAERYRLPRPRCGLGQQLVGRATACIDVSDGLLADLGHIARASEARLIVERSRLPLSGPVRRLIAAAGDDDSAWAPVLSGGDDYELAFTLPEDRLPALAAAVQAEVPLTVIGRVEAAGAGTAGRPGVDLLDSGGRRLAVHRTGWLHREAAEEGTPRS